MPVTRGVQPPLSKIVVRASRLSGPGGQHPSAIPVEPAGWLVFVGHPQPDRRLARTRVMDIGRREGAGGDQAHHRDDREGVCDLDALGLSSSGSDSASTS